MYLLEEHQPIIVGIEEINGTDKIYIGRNYEQLYRN